MSKRAPKKATKPTTPAARVRRKGRRPASLPDWRPVFLANLAGGMTATAACAAAGVTRQTVYAIKDESFLQAKADAELASAELLEAEARRRAMEGVDEPVFHEGSICGYKRRYSDTLMIFLLKGRNREVFGDAVKVDHDDSLRTVADGESATADFLARLRGRVGAKPR